MALIIGSEDAAGGMSLLIYQELDRLLSPSLQQAVNTAQDEAKKGAQEALDGARAGWKKLSYAIANGVIAHILTNLEICGVATHGNVSGAVVSGNTGTALPNNHSHSVNLSGIQNNIVFTQNNDGTGHIR
ncbi:MAG: hypothetical protein ABSE41_06295 [Bacteroidota bacterium]|jgi:ABC-type sulfate transport system substrate-binding protein